MIAELPLVSIITPSYNQAQYLEATILSVLQQDYPRIEYIIMDGGSSDDSVEIIQKYVGRLAYWVSEKDRGQVDAINRGFARCNGKIMAWLNSDDTYEPGAIQAAVTAFRQHPKVRLVYGEGWYIDGAGRRTRPCRFVRESFPNIYIYNKDPILQQASFWKRNLWEEVGPLDESMNWVFDWDWFIRAHKVTSFLYIPQFLANYRVHSQAKTRSSDIQRRIEQARITKTYGKWWHPNYLTQQARITEYQIVQYTKRWPRFLSFLLQKTASFFRLIVERIFYGMYTT
jgi:glycosyltransferase involved in cell wall biosynthesis